MKICKSKSASLLIAYRDGELTPSQRQETERHLAECSVCRQELVEMRQEDDLLRSALGAQVVVSERIIPSVWARIEREDRMARSSKDPRRSSAGPRLGVFSFPRLLGLAGGAAVAAMLLLGLFLRPQAIGPIDMKIASIEGGSLWKTDDSSDWIQAKIGLILHSGDDLKTDPSGRVTLVWQDGTKAILGPNSESSALHLFPGVELKKGGIWVKAKKRQSQETPFTVKSSEATLQVMGTEFVAELLKESPALAVRVMQGGVRVFNAQGSITVREWMQSETRLNAKPSAPQPFSPLSNNSAWWL